MEFADALVAAKQGRAMALLGAGFSVGAVNGKGKELPIGGQLAKNLLNAIGVRDTADYGLAAELYRKAHKANPTALATFLKEEFEVATVLPEHVAFAAQPWRSIYTTNFDNVVETASAKAGITRRPVTTARAPNQLDRTDPWIVHLHGYVGELSGQGFIQPFVLSRSSYLDIELPRTPWPTKLQTDAAGASAIFVVGHSLGDVHIAKMLRTTPSNKRKTFIILEASPSAALVAYAEEFGSVLPIGVDGLVKAIEAAKVPEADQEADKPLLAFKRVALPDQTREPTPADVQQLLLGGTFDPAVFLHSELDNSRPYTFSRNEALRRLATWKADTRKLLVYSRIGNGKTVFLRQCAVLFAQQGFNVYEGQHLLESFHAELDKIRNSGGPYAFIFDGVREYEEPIKAVAQTLDARDVLLVATRPTAFATDFQNLNNVLGEGFHRIDLDTLSAADVIQVDRLLEFYGLWGKVGGRTQAARLSFIRNDCGGEARSVVLHVFRHSEISQRIREPVERLLREDPLFAQTLASILVVRLSDALVDFYDVCELMGTESSDVQDVFGRCGIGDFFPDEGEQFRARSAILAEHILGTLLPPAVCSNALALLVERLIDYRSADERYDESIPKVVRFAVITRVFQGKERRPFIGHLYERLLTADFLRADPQFWLQFAMARMEEEDWASAEKCLETAYTTAKARPGYRTYMLDNQMAKFYLEGSIGGYLRDTDVAAKAAADLISRRIGPAGAEIDIYTFRLVQPLLDFKDQLRLSTASVRLVDGLLKSLADRLGETRRRRELEDEEERVWRALNRRASEGQRGSRR